MNYSKAIVVYFSHKGENYYNKKLIQLEKGNTEYIVDIINGYLNIPAFEILEKNPYPNSYYECIKIAKTELINNFRPELKNDIDLTNYDTIILGYPNWLDSMPMPVWTFLENHDMNNKTIIPFCTYEGSRLGKSISNIKSLCPKAIVKDGIAIYTADVKMAKTPIIEWLNNL